MTQSEREEEKRLFADAKKLEERDRESSSTKFGVRQGLEG